MHEHQHPRAGIARNRAAVIRELSGPPNNWSEAVIQRNVFGLYSESETNFSAFDPKSIMLYFFPKTWTLDGKGTGVNEALSEIDQTFIASIYPGAASVVAAIEPRKIWPTENDLSKESLAVLRRLAMFVPGATNEGC